MLFSVSSVHFLPHRISHKFSFEFYSVSSVSANYSMDQDHRTFSTQCWAVILQLAFAGTSSSLLSEPCNPAGLCSLSQFIATRRSKMCCGSAMTLQFGPGAASHIAVSDAVHENG